MTRTIHATPATTGPGWAAYCRLREQLETPLDWESAAIRPWWQSLHQPHHDAPEDAALDAALEAVGGSLGWEWDWSSPTDRTRAWVPAREANGDWERMNAVFDHGIPTRELRSRLCLDMRPYAYDAHGNETGPALGDGVELWMPCPACGGRGWVEFAEQYPDVPCRQCGGYTETTRPVPSGHANGRVLRIEQDEREPVAGPDVGAQWCGSLHPEFPGEYVVYAVHRDFLFRRTNSAHAIQIARAPHRRDSHPDTITLTSGRTITRARLGE